LRGAGRRRAHSGRIDRAWEPFAKALVEREGRSHLLLTLADFVSAPGMTTKAA